MSRAEAEDLSHSGDPALTAVEAPFEEVAPDQLIHEWRVVG